jgi:hypothetical protein
MNVMIPGEREELFAFLYPLLAMYPKKGASPKGCTSFQCHSPGSQGRFLMMPDSKIQYVLFHWLASGGSLATLRDAPCLSRNRTLIRDKLSGRMMSF